MTHPANDMPEGCFDPTQIALMRVTLTVACNQLGHDNVDNDVRVRLAAIILDTTRTGERDPTVLAEMALQRLAIAKVSLRIAY